MKTHCSLSIVASCAFSLLALHTDVSAATWPAKKINDTEKEKKTKIASSRNNHAVKIYPDAVKRIMHVVAKENKGKEIDFFVFDLQGELVKHYKMISGDHERLNGLKRGRYVYNVFSGDEQTAAGEFEIR